MASKETDINNVDFSPKIVVIAFGGSYNILTQKTRIETVSKWLTNPSSPIEKNDSFNISNSVNSNPDQISLSISEKLIIPQRLNQLIGDISKLNKTDYELLKAGVVACEQSWTLDDTLDTVVELRLRPAPINGWNKNG